MSVRIIVGAESGTEGREVAVLFDAVTGRAFGPLFDGGYEEADDFCAWWAEYEPRSPLTRMEHADIVKAVRDYHRAETCSDCGLRRPLNPTHAGRCDDCHCDHVSLPECAGCGEHAEVSGPGLCDTCRDHRAADADIARSLR